jgi:hypothetical protein
MIEKADENQKDIYPIPPKIFVSDHGVGDI